MRSVIRESLDDKVRVAASIAVESFRKPLQVPVDLGIVQQRLPRLNISGQLPPKRPCLFERRIIRILCGRQDRSKSA